MFFMLTISLLALIFSTAALAQQRYVAHLNGNQEVPANNSTGRGVCDIVLNLAETQITVTCNYNSLTSPANAGHIHDNGPVGVIGPVRFNFGTVSGTSGTIGPLNFAVTAAQVADLRAKRWYCNIHSTAFPNGEIRGQVKPAANNTIFDLDGDSRTDIAVFRDSANAFYTLSSLNNTVLITNIFGSDAVDTRLSFSGDYDGDGRADPVLLRGISGALYWIILQSGTNTVRIVQWGGSSGDLFAPSDYDGDGKTDIAVFRRTIGAGAEITGVWYILQSSNGQQRIEYFGQTGDLSLVGDKDGDGKADLTIGRAEGTQIAWYTRRSSDNAISKILLGEAATDSVFTFAHIDIDGDNRQDIMVTRGPTGGQRQYFINRSSDNQLVTINWGLASDGVQFGDFDGDGKTDFVARRTVNGQFIWYILQSSNNYDPAQARAVQFGITGDQ
jgi:hypothetical protein